MKILKDQHLIVFENLGSKAPGLAAFLKWLDFEFGEGDIFDEFMVYKDYYAEDGNLYIEWDPKSRWMEGDPETFPERFLECLKENGAKELKLCREVEAKDNADGYGDPDWSLLRMINEGDSDAGISETPGANYEYGDEELLWDQLKSPIGESMTIEKAKKIIESSGLSLQRA